MAARQLGGFGQTTIIKKNSKEGKGEREGRKPLPANADSVDILKLGSKDGNAVKSNEEGTSLFDLAWGMARRDL